MSVYSFDESSEATPLDNFILRASLRAENVTIAKRLRQAIILNDLELGRRELNAQVMAWSSRINKTIDSLSFHSSLPSFRFIV